MNSNYEKEKFCAPSLLGSACANKSVPHLTKPGDNLQAAMLLEKRNAKVSPGLLYDYNIGIH